jgi:hypothetical protein
VRTVIPADFLNFFIEIDGFLLAQSVIYPMTEEVLLPSFDSPATESQMLSS